MSRWVHRGRLDRFGCRFILDVAAERSGQLEPVDRDRLRPSAATALIDTGAQASLISVELATRLLLPKIGNARMSSTVASARVDVVRALLFLPSEASIGMSGRRVRFLLGEVRDADILFGLDLLRGGQFLLDGVSGHWSWSLERLPWPEQSEWT